MLHKDFSQFLETIQAGTLWIIDIDSTLVLTHKRNEAVLRRFAEEHQSLRPEFCAKVARAECLPMEYGYARAIERVDAHTDAEGCQDLAAFWRTWFFSNDFLHHDLPHERAVEFVTALKDGGWPFVFLTGRPRPSMLEGSLRALNQFGFEVTEEQLFLKPDPADRDELFKSRQVAEFRKTYPEMVFFDNEPKVLCQIKKDHPEIPQIFMDTCHSPNVIAPPEAFVVRNFTPVIEALKARSS